MDDLREEARLNPELEPDSKELIHELDERWHTIDNWSDERENKLTMVIGLWQNLREQEVDLLEKLEAKDVRLKEISLPVDLSNSEDTNEQREDLKVWIF